MRFKRISTGSFEKDWEKYKSSIKANEEAEINFLMRTGANRQTIHDWLNKKGRMPAGQYIVKLFFLLKERGYEVTEIEKLDDEIKILGIAFMHNKISFEEIHRASGLTHGNILRVLRGVSKASEVVKKRMRHRIPLFLLPSKNVDGDKEKSASRIFTGEDKSLVADFTKELRSFLPLLEKAVFHKEKAVRAELCEALGDEFELFQRLTRALASEDARRMILSEEGFKNLYHAKGGDEK